MFINVLMRMLAYDLEQRGIHDPLRQPFRYADLWSELARLQGEPIPHDVADILKESPFSGMQQPKMDGDP